VTYQTESGLLVTVTAAEMRAQVTALARCNDWSPLLVNTAVKAGERLSCKLVEHVPQGWGFDSSGYIMMRFQRASTPRGHSFSGGATADKDADYVSHSRQRRRCATAPMADTGGSHAIPVLPPASPLASRRHKTSGLRHLVC